MCKPVKEIPNMEEITDEFALLIISWYMHADLHFCYLQMHEAGFLSRGLSYVLCGKDRAQNYIYSMTKFFLLHVPSKDEQVRSHALLT